MALGRVALALMLDGWTTVCVRSGPHGTEARTRWARRWGVDKATRLPHVERRVIDDGEVLAQVVRAREAAVDGDAPYLEQILETLEHELAGRFASGRGSADG